jgi:hypothetical protein
LFPPPPPPHPYVKMVWVEDAQGKHGEDHLDRPAAAVDKVTVEKVGVGLGRHAVDLKELAQVVKLAMRVAADSDLEKGGKIKGESIL